MCCAVRSAFGGVPGSADPQIPGSPRPTGTAPTGRPTRANQYLWVPRSDPQILIFPDTYIPGFPRPAGTTATG